MKHPHDPHELLLRPNHSLRLVDIQRRLMLVYDPITNEASERHIGAYLVRFADRRTQHLEEIANKVEFAPGLWLVVAGVLDDENHFWLTRSSEASPQAAMPAETPLPPQSAAPAAVQVPPSIPEAAPSSGPLRDSKGRFVKRRKTA